MLEHDDRGSQRARRFSARATAMGEAAEALRESERRLQALYDDTPSMLFTVDETGFIQSVNRFAARTLGYRVEELVGRPFDILHDAEHADRVDERLHACIGAGDAVERWESRLLCRDGSRLWVRVTARQQPAIRDARPVLVVCEDVTEARVLAEELSHQARHDALTGLPNRGEFERRLGELLSAGAGDAPFAVAHVDLDHFKVLNGTSGHLAGDELLRQLASAMAESLGSQDVLARLGADEFGVLMRGESARSATRTAERLRRSIADFRFSWLRQPFPLGSSVGLVTAERTVSAAGSGGLHDLLCRADSACRAAKDEGGNRVYLDDPEDHEIARRQGEVRWLSGIRSALAENRLRLFQQPIQALAAADDGGEHVELLLRVVEPDGSLAAPAGFLAAAERFHLVPSVDRWVVGAALAWLESRLPTLGRHDTASINLSGFSVGDPDFRTWLLDRVRETPVPTHHLCFEITETAVIGSLEAARALIEPLRALGCRFALDDFGSGVSSFGYLKQLPVDVVKIDGLFVRDLLDDPMDRALVRSITEIGHVTGKAIVAEFVENRATADALAAMGVDYGQGFGLGRPRPLDANGA